MLFVIERTYKVSSIVTLAEKMISALKNLLAGIFTHKKKLADGHYTNSTSNQEPSLQHIDECSL
jgi:leucyl aminopeptidase